MQGLAAQLFDLHSAPTSQPRFESQYVVTALARSRHDRADRARCNWVIGQPPRAVPPGCEAIGEGQVLASAYLVACLVVRALAARGAVCV